MPSPQSPLDPQAAPDTTRLVPPLLENVQYLARAQYGDPLMPVAALNASGPIATLEESVRCQWQRYAAGMPLDVNPTFSAAPQSEYYGSVVLPNGQRLHRSAGFNVFRIFRDHKTGQPFTMSRHEFTFHVSTPDDPHRIWDLELCYPSDDRLSAAMATLPTIDGQTPLSYPVHATTQAPPMIPLSHRVATGLGQFKVATADAVMRESQTSVSPEELVEDPGTLLYGRACSPFSAIIMGPHGARFEATMARDIYRRARESLRLSGDKLFSADSDNDSLPDLVSIADSSLDSESVDVDLGICQLCFEIHPHAPWDCLLFGTTEPSENNRSPESGTAVGSDTSAEKVGEESLPDEAEEVRKAFKDFTIAFDAPENEKEFRSVVDMLEHEAADGLRALAAGLRVEHAAVDELREIEDGIRRLETEEREAADPVRADSPYPRLILRCEVSERAMHCSSPHGPCEPSARMTDELGRTRRIFHNGILRYRKQLPSETNALPISQTPSSLSNSLPRHRARPYTHLRRSRPTLSSTWTIRFSDTPRYDRSPPVAERVADPFCCRFHTTSRAGRTLPVPDADPADEAELIPTPPPPPLHTMHRLAEGDHSSLPLPERSSAFRCDHQAVPEALVVF
ncbi:hypothetical protein B0H14DRAFT_3525300 [Mycena olivaceomarginata]|nr:hypothetical protein B0H14DRAFT_3525300 [Mycena olivaceomarginata]